MHKFNKDPDTFESMKSAKVLIIDDLGQEDEDIARALRECLDARKSRRGRVTVITTNLTEALLLERYGEAVRDRMREMFVRAEINAGSYRQSEPGW
jgi:DNA replication protein DnaC